MMLVGLAFCVGVLAWWLTKRLSCRDSFLFKLDHPNERSLHDIPIPRTGGMAMIGSLSWDYRCPCTWTSGFERRSISVGLGVS